MLLILHIPLILIRGSLLLIWQLMSQLKLTSMWFKNLFILELRLNLETERQRKLKLILGLIILANWFTRLDTGHQEILFHASVQFWKMNDRWGCYEIVFLGSLKFFMKWSAQFGIKHTWVCILDFGWYFASCFNLSQTLYPALQFPGELERGSMQVWLPKVLIMVLVVLMTVQCKLWLHPCIVRFFIFQHTASPLFPLVLYRRRTRKIDIGSVQHSNIRLKKIPLDPS